MSRQISSLSFRKASFLDVPLIFDLISEGAINGSFSDKFIQRTGKFRLLGLVLSGVVSQHLQMWFSPKHYDWQVISDASREDVGFLKLWNGNEVSRHHNLEFLAISPSHRNRGIGIKVLEHITSNLPEGAQLIVHCTKYARAMQHILKRHQFRRNTKFGVPGLEEYISIRGGL